MFTMQDVVREADLLRLPSGKMVKAEDVETRTILGTECYVLERHGYETLVPLNQPVDLSMAMIQTQAWQSHGQVEVEFRFEAYVLDSVGRILKERQG